MVILVWIAAIIYDYNHEFYVWEDDWYTANAQFRRYTKDFNILCVEVEDGKIILTLEDKYHIVCITRITEVVCKTQTRTDITEPILDLPASTLFLPYNYNMV